ncbi:MAG: GNAT family N-acetyltransferase [Anaerolineales bacterium]|nr:GNAT family N-acetyltransferase [Anaerolineales bacterium]
MIYGNRIRLRKLEKADLPLFVAWFNDPEVRAGIGMYLPMSQVEEDRWFERMVERPPVEHILAVEIRDEAGWRLVGSTSLFDFDWRVRKAEFGILLGDKTIWNQGYGTEVTRLMLQHGFETLNLNRIELKVYSTNPRAQRAYEKAGYVLEGTQRQADYRNGQYVDDHFMAVLRDEWFARK